ALQGGRDGRAHPRPGPHDHVNRLNALHRCLLRSPESLVTAPSGLSWRRDFAGREHRMDFELFDSDNHYYEPEDCFTRYGDETVKRYVTWVSEGKKRHLLFGNHKTNDSRNPNSVMNPTFNPVAKPGAFATTLAALERGERVTGPVSRMLGEL